MSAAPEVVTIQAGNFSNFIGTHWWNIQESSFCYNPDSSIPLDINHDVMFREGLNLYGEVTYTPRLVLIDLQDNLTSIRKECPLYRTPNEDKKEPLWDGPVEVIKSQEVKKNPFLDEFERLSELSRVGTNVDGNRIGEPSNSQELYDFNKPTTVWCDFLKTNLHPRSLCLFQEPNPSDEKSPLDLYSSGEEIYLKSGKEMIEDSVRRMCEECDNLQGFHLLFDAHNGFSGITNNVLQYLEDEYRRKPSLCFPVFQENKDMPIQDVKEQMHRLYAILNSMNNLNNYCTFFSPLSLSEDVVKLAEPYKSFPFIEYDPTLLYNTSAIYAAAIETLTSPYRLKSLNCDMHQLTSSVLTYGRKMVSSSASLPFPLSHDAYLSAMIEKDVPEYYMTSLTPFYKPDSERAVLQYSVLRGVPVNKFQNPKKIFHAQTSDEIFVDYLSKYSPSSMINVSVFPEMCSVTAPFPKFFKPIVSDCGFLKQHVTLNQKGVSKIPVAASFVSSDSAGKFIGDLISEALKLPFKEYVKCTETTYEKDNHVEIIENLRNLQDNYQDY
ncbi:protein misato homolog 1 [Trichonephila inaurata madagascariensis]|uniref:Protein misato homolog 1 n=1 Tax=Trichonephila inaurata madagascariensis TaxID=2747483 RepID=A0A8X6XUL8_9ARAC|nr:protein misato homolog 1 [Trichonephila inaurata madagascariensis]